ncbi:hypothetical protein EJB05_48790, partial [Eragrostis curvula]
MKGKKANSAQSFILPLEEDALAVSMSFPLWFAISNILLWNNIIAATLKHQKGQEVAPINPSLFPLNHLSFITHRATCEGEAKKKKGQTHKEERGSSQGNKQSKVSLHSPSMCTSKKTSCKPCNEHKKQKKA